LDVRAFWAFKTSGDLVVRLMSMVDLEGEELIVRENLVVENSVGK
jgi:hypothetical protein